jgi:hypothetical protein
MGKNDEAVWRDGRLNGDGGGSHQPESFMGISTGIFNDIEMEKVACSPCAHVHAKRPSLQLPFVSISSIDTETLVCT